MKWERHAHVSRWSGYRFFSSRWSGCGCALVAWTVFAAAALVAAGEFEGRIAIALELAREKPQEKSIANIVDDSDQYATPQVLVDKILRYLNPQPHETFIDPGCGDGRALIAAAKQYGCQSIGIEVDPGRVALARKNAEVAGVADKVTIIEADFKTIDWPAADVGYAYLFPEDLKPIRNKLLTLDRFACFAHKVPALPMHNVGNRFYTWQHSRVFAWWDGNAYYSRPNAGCNCPMCQSVVASLTEQRSHRRQPMRQQVVAAQSQIVVYTTPNCLPCARLKRAMLSAGIPFTERRGAAGRSVPYVVVDGRLYSGSAIYQAVGLN
jgi:SAM-dependent methyltransferase/glutaredoxin